MKYPVGTRVRAVTQEGQLTGSIFKYRDSHFKVGMVGTVKPSAFMERRSGYSRYLWVDFDGMPPGGGYLANCFEKIEIEDTFEKDGIE